MNRKDSEIIVKGLVAVLKPLFARVKALEAAHATLEKSHAELKEKALTGGAPWQRGVTYAKNETAPHDGSLWRCIEAHTSGIAFSHEHFLLQVKRGREGKGFK